MKTVSTSSTSFSFDEDDVPLIPVRSSHHEANFDITAMIDLVFMLNIFFLVTTVAAAQAELNLPIVRHCIPTDPDDAVILSLIATDLQTAALHLGDGAQGTGVTDHEEQVRDVRQAVAEASRAGKRIVLLKAERSVKLRDIKRIGAAAMRDQSGMELRMAVIEKE